jgi:hypothetical protein
MYQLRLDMPTLHRATAPSGPDDVGDARSSFHSTIGDPRSWPCARARRGRLIETGCRSPPHLERKSCICKTISAEIEINDIHVTPCSSVRHAKQFRLRRLETNCALGRWPWLDSETGGSRGERSVNKNHVVVKGMGEEKSIYRIKKALRPPPQLRSRAQPFPALELAN